MVCATHCWIKVTNERRSTVDTSAESSGAVNLLSDGYLTGKEVLIIGSITIVAFIANSNIWITSNLSLTDPKGPWRSCINRELGIEWSYQGGDAISLEKLTSQNWACLKWCSCCCL